MPQEPSFKSVFESIWRIEKAVLETVDFEESTRRVVNIILTELGYINVGYEVIVLSLLDHEKKVLRRIAISRTRAAESFLKATPIPFNEILIPLTAKDNLSVRSINERKIFTTPNVHEVLVPAISREWVDNFQKVLGIKTTIVFPIVAKDKVLGSLIFSLSKEEKEISQEEWIILDSFVGAVGIALDNALLYRSIEDANEKLKQLDRLKDEFVSLASHELRTPMTIIKSYLWMVMNKKSNLSPEKEKSYLDRAYESTQRLINLVNNMLNVSRIESGRLKLEMKELDLIVHAQRIISELVPRAKQLNLSLNLVMPTTPVKNIFADPDKIEQILINLIGNSFKFTPPGGKINVSITPRQSDILVAIADNGKGMDSIQMSALFQRFATMGGNYLTKENIQGSGLGLYISKSLVELHGGKITARSEGPGKGSTFSFTLPYTQPKQS